MVLFVDHGQRPYTEQRCPLTTLSLPHEGPLLGMVAAATVDPSRTFCERANFPARAAVGSDSGSRGLRVLRPGPPTSGAGREAR